MPIEPPPGFWEREASHNPKPLSPFCSSLELPTVNAGFRAMCDEFGFVLDTLELREIGGWVYLQAVPITDPDRLARRIERCRMSYAPNITASC
jgi:pyruvate,water dikinase